MEVQTMKMWLTKKKEEEERWEDLGVLRLVG